MEWLNKLLGWTTENKDGLELCLKALTCVVSGVWLFYCRVADKKRKEKEKQKEQMVVTINNENRGDWSSDTGGLKPVVIKRRKGGGAR